jgi:hypothetical protein
VGTVAPGFGFGGLQEAVEAFQDTVLGTAAKAASIPAGRGRPSLAGLAYWSREKGRIVGKLFCNILNYLVPATGIEPVTF